MIDRPKGIEILAHEACAVFSVEASADRARLWYPALACVVPFSADVIIVADEEKNLFRAQCFAATVREAGYQNVKVECAACHK